jgi:hypothetical protein
MMQSPSLLSMIAEARYQEVMRTAAATRIVRPKR